MGLRQRHLGTTAALALLLGTAACGRDTAALDDELRRDLEAATAAGVTLAPTGARTQVVSAIERTGGAERAAAPTPRATPRPAPRVTRAAPQPAPRRVAAAPRPAPTPEAPPAPESPPEPVFAEAPVAAPAPRPTPTQAPQPARRGGYKTVGEVIRDAPFPIYP